MSFYFWVTKYLEVLVNEAWSPSPPSNLFLLDVLGHDAKGKSHPNIFSQMVIFHGHLFTMVNSGKKHQQNNVTEKFLTPF